MGSLFKFVFVVLFALPVSAADFPELCQRDNPELEIISSYNLEGLWQRLIYVWQQGAQNELPGRHRIRNALFAAKEAYVLDVAAFREISSEVLRLEPESRYELNHILRNFVAELSDQNMDLELDLKDLPWDQKGGMMEVQKVSLKKALINAYQPKVQRILQRVGKPKNRVKKMSRKLLSLLPNGPQLDFPEEYMEVHDYVMDLVKSTKTFPDSTMTLPDGFFWRESNINEIANAGLNINIVLRYSDMSQKKNVNMRLTFSPLPELGSRVSMHICRPGLGSCEPIPLREFCEKLSPKTRP